MKLVAEVHKEPISIILNKDGTQEAKFMKHETETLAVLWSRGLLSEVEILSTEDEMCGEGEFDKGF